MMDMNRRRFFGVLGGAMAALPFVGRAAEMPRDTGELVRAEPIEGNVEYAYSVWTNAEPVYPVRMEPGKLYCPRCDAGVFPMGDKWAVYHASRERFAQDRDYEVFVGTTKLLNVYEAYQGEAPEDSWIIRGDRTPPSACLTCGHAYMRVFEPGVPIELRRNGVPVR